MKVLVTARDVGAALHIIEIVKTGLKDPDLTFNIYAQQPAASYFQAENLMVNVLPSYQAADYSNDLLKLSQSIIYKCQPDVILSGLSTPFDGGIDEAIVTIAKNKILTFVLQDYWGGLNSHFGQKADFYFCLDERAALLTSTNHDVNTINLGSCKHASYNKINVLKKRDLFYAKNKISKDKKLIGFFGQPLYQLEGYRRTISVWAKKIAKLNQDVIVAYRPHPNESLEDIKHTSKLLKQFNINHILLRQKKPEDALSLCDIVCSPFSTCSFDACYLNYFAKFPIIVPINLLFDKEIINYYSNVINVEDTPYIQKGLAYNVKYISDLKVTLEFAFTKVGREQIWQASKQLQNPINSTKKAIQIIKEKKKAYLKPSVPGIIQ